VLAEGLKTKVDAFGFRDNFDGAGLGDGAASAWDSQSSILICLARVPGWVCPRSRSCVDESWGDLGGVQHTHDVKMQAHPLKQNLLRFRVATCSCI
jgi:hypothetical protein